MKTTVPETLFNNVADLSSGRLLLLFFEKYLTHSFIYPFNPFVCKIFFLRGPNFFTTLCVTQKKKIKYSSKIPVLGELFWVSKSDLKKLEPVFLRIFHVIFQITKKRGEKTWHWIFSLFTLGKNRKR